MSHMERPYSNITVVQSVTPALRVNVCPQANASWSAGWLAGHMYDCNDPGDSFHRFIPIQNSVMLLI
jgi:hypothetical protein